MAALLAGLRLHGRRGAEPSSLHFLLRLCAQYEKQRLMRRAVQVDRPVDLWQPQLHAVLAK